MIKRDALQLPEEMAKPVVPYVKHAWTQSFSFAFLVGLSIVALVVLTSFFIGSGSLQRDKEKQASVQAVVE